MLHTLNPEQMEDLLSARFAQAPYSLTPEMRKLAQEQDAYRRENGVPHACHVIHFTVRNDMLERVSRSNNDKASE